MPSLKDIRRRIGSVKSTQKITRAMKLVSAAKFARANAAVVASRPYGRALDEMVSRLVTAAGEEYVSPLTTVRAEERVLLAVLATDRGFCGALNSNLFKATQQFLAAKAAEGVEVELAALGRRARHFAGKTRFKIAASREKVLERVNFEGARDLANDLLERFESGAYDAVYVAYVEFKSALTQSPTVKALLPLSKLAVQSGEKGAGESPLVIIEPSLKEVLDTLLRREVTSLVFRCMLEGAASEHGARMSAMDSATNNANTVLKRMSIQYNRARQAAITKELIEITSGAQAL